MSVPQDTSQPNIEPGLLMRLQATQRAQEILNYARDLKPNDAEAVQKLKSLAESLRDDIERQIKPDDSRYKSFRELALWKLGDILHHCEAPRLKRKDKFNMYRHAGVLLKRIKTIEKRMQGNDDGAKGQDTTVVGEELSRTT